MKRFLCVVLTGVLMLSGCSTSGTGDERTEILSAIEKLKENDDYVISSYLSDPSGELYGVDVVSPEGHYTEYPLDDEDNIGTLDYGEKAETRYTLSDWTTTDGTTYIMSEEDGILKLPSSYNKYIDGRKDMFVSDLLAGATEISREDSMDLDIVGTPVSLAVYKLKVRADVVKNVLGATSYGIYKSIQEEHEGDNIGTLCDYYIDDFDFRLVTSDANVYIGVDINGVLRYMCLEVGGLGARLYMTKIVVELGNSNPRDLPDFSTAVDFSVTLSDLADFVASYDSYEDALDALSSMPEVDSNLGREETYDSESE